MDLFPEVIFPGLITRTSPVQPVLWFSSELSPDAYDTPISNAAGVDYFTWQTLSGKFFYPWNPIALVVNPSENTLDVIQLVGAPLQFQTVNGAEFIGPNVAPGSLATIFSKTTLTQEYFAASFPLPRNLGGLALRIGGELRLVNDTWIYDSANSVLAPLVYAGPTQINFQVPYEIAPRSLLVLQLELPDGATKVWGSTKIVPSSPGIFKINNYLAAALNQDNSRHGDPTILPGSSPAAKGSVLQLFLTGAGAVDPPIATGEAAPFSPLSYTRSQPVLYLTGVNPPNHRTIPAIQFSGIAPGFAGVWQVNIVIPQDADSGLNCLTLTGITCAYVAVK